MLARAALGAIIKGAAKSAAKKVATKEVGKVAEKAVAKTATKVSKATPKKSLSSSAAKESKARGDGPSKGELKGWAREAKANRDAKTADHYEGPKEPATSSGRKLGDKPKAKATAAKKSRQNSGVANPREKARFDKFTAVGKNPANEV